MKADVTFFIPVKNGSPYIEDCIGSVISQSFKNWRLLILDNRSTDNTAALCGKHQSDERISYILNPTDIGPMRNFNQCLDLCETRYYAILSHDDRYSDDRAVEDSFSLLEKDPDLCAVYSHIHWIDGQNRRIATKRFSLTGKVLSDNVAKKSIQSCRNQFGVPLLIRSSAAAGKKYDHSVYSTSDIDFSIAIGRGLFNYVIDRPCYSIRFHSSNNTMRDFSKIRQELIRIAEKHGISLSAADTMQMSISDWKMRLGKRLFFLYMDHLRNAGLINAQR
ncbi:MAG: glycosyltransferase family A protein [Gammaproteobacteria bacterium]